MCKAFFICLLGLAIAGCSNSDPDTTSKSKSNDSDVAETESAAGANSADSASSSSEIATAPVEPEPEFIFDNSTFESPTIIAFGGNKNFNHTLYPSPAIFDVDNDGVDELVLGDLFGSLKSSENENAGKGDPVWSTPVSLKTEDQKPIDMENW